MTTYYKLTDHQFKTFNNTKWGENITHIAKGRGNALCTSDCIHVYDHPLKAVFFNPIHARFQKPVLWKCSISGIVARDSTKIGVKACTTIHQVPLPIITTNQRIRAAIYFAQLTKCPTAFSIWAARWLSGEDRTSTSAYAATSASAATAYAATSASAATAYASAYAAHAATSAYAAAVPNNSIIRILKRAIKEENG